MKILMWTITLVSLLLLSSCLDIFHFVSLGNNKTELYIKYSIQKSIVDMASALTGEEFDYSEFTNIGDEAFEDLLGYSVDINSFETELEVGAELKFIGASTTIQSEIQGQISYIVTKENGYFRILIPGLGSDEDDDVMSVALFSSVKYKLLVELSGDLRNVSRAEIYVEGVAISDKTLFNTNIFGSSMYIDFPMMILIYTMGDIEIRLFPN